MAVTLLTRAEAASWLSVSLRTFDGLDMPYAMVGKRKRYYLEDLEACLRRRKGGDSSGAAASAVYVSRTARSDANSRECNQPLSAWTIESAWRSGA